MSASEPEVRDPGNAPSDLGQTTTSSRGSEWSLIAGVLRERITRPFSRPMAVFYFFLCILLGGGAGLWVSLGILRASTDGQSALLSALLSIATYGGALFGTAVLDTILEVDLDRTARLSLQSYCALSLVATAALVTVWRFWADDGGVYKVFSWISFTLALFFIWGSWWVVSASDRRFMLDPMAPAGGDPNRELRNS